jgi:hypothetical protein
MLAYVSLVQVSSVYVRLGYVRRCDARMGPFMTHLARLCEVGSGYLALG